MVNKEHQGSFDHASVLIVDDEVSVQNMLGSVLERQGYICSFARDTAEARKCLAKQDFDLILCDIVMPGESGLELIRHAKRQSPDTAVVMVTGVDDPKTAKVALDAGVYGYIIKPAEPNQILINVANALRRRELEKKANAHQKDLEYAVHDKTLELKEKNAELQKAYSDLRETQARIIQQEKMASIGQLAAGVAHEINNPTGFVSSNLKTLEDYQRDLFKLIQRNEELTNLLKKDSGLSHCHASVMEQLKNIDALGSEIDKEFILEDIPKLLKESREGMERIKKIVVDLKDFAHPGTQEYVYADINKSLDSTLNIVWNEVKYKATVEKIYGELPEVWCCPQQLNQVFLNLLINAAQAIEKQGSIGIATGTRDDHVWVKIRDTGMGIPHEILGKIFDPFFTTKEVGKGTGLGLNVAYNIVKKHRGEIHVDSEVGKGTTFSITIPIKPSKKLVATMASENAAAVSTHCH